MAGKNLIESYFDKLNREILPGIDFERLDHSCNSPDNSYAAGVLKEMHKAFVEVYGTDKLEYDGEHEFVCIPAVVRARKTGRLAVGLIDLDLESSDEHWGTRFFSSKGILEQGSERNNEKENAYIRESYIPYDYWYTPKLDGDIHIDPGSAPEAVANLLSEARGWQQPGQGGMEMK